MALRFTNFRRLAPAPRQWSLLALSCIATLSNWLENLAALCQPIRRVKLKPVVASFTHFPALGSRSTPVILDFDVLHCYTFWLVKKISRYSINQSEDYNLNQSWLGSFILPRFAHPLHGTCISMFCNTQFQSWCYWLSLCLFKSLYSTVSLRFIGSQDLYLYYFLSRYPGRTLVFSNTVDCIRRLGSLFRLLNFDPWVLHASMQQRQRLKNLDRQA